MQGDKIKCVWCGESFTNKIALANHYDNEHKGKL